MTFLELFVRYVHEVDLAVASDPTDVENQTGELGDIVNWLIESWKDLQTRHGGQWPWLRHTFTFPTVASQAQYEFGDCTDSELSATITRFRTWRLNDEWQPPKIFLTSAGQGAETWLTYTPWPSYYQIYLIGNNRTTEGYPAHITEDPLQRIRLGPIPNDIYTVESDYWLSSQILAVNADEPEMPSDYHMLIVYRAMLDYGYRSISPEVLARSEIRGDQILRNLEGNRFPEFRTAGSMA